MNIAFTGRTFRSVGDLFIQVIVDGRVVSCIVTSEALALCACEQKGGASAEDIYRLHRDLIEQIASGLIQAGIQAPIIVRGRDLAASCALPAQGTHGPAG